jgi:2-keto-3-deoxy-L-rhamnonate aldolase RhmA
VKNIVWEKFKEGKKTIGTFSHLQNATVIECMKYTGLDYVVIDMEHSPVTAEGASQYIAAANSAGMVPFVRVDEVARSPILKMLDAGAQAVIVPCVDTLEQAQQLVQFAKFAPLGSRGFCPTRDGGWGFAEHACSSIEEYMQICNKETLLILQCETTGCLENIEKVTLLQGVDGILIGPFDLSIALGKPAKFDDPEIKNAFQRILKACKSAGKMCIIFAGSADAAKKYYEEGFDSVAVGLDSIIFINSYRQIVKEAMNMGS